MDELIKRITEKTGISEDQARSAVNTVAGFLKEIIEKAEAQTLNISPRR